MSKKVKISVIASFMLASFVAVTGVAQAQTGKAAVVLLVDSQEIIQESLAGKSYLSQVEIAQAELQQDANSRQQDLAKELQELQRQEALVDASVYEQKRRELEQKAVASEGELRGKTQRLRIAASKAQAKLQAALDPIYETLLDKYKANIMLDQSRVVAHGTGMDVTEEVISSLNKKLPELTLEIADE